MAKISIKTDFKDGDKLFAVQLNNNFKTIQEAWDTVNGIIWDGNSGVFVSMYRGTTEDINKRDIEDGQILYNTETGETFLDVNTKRINTGSGNVIKVQEDEPTNEATILWINPDEGIDSIGTEIVNDMNGNQTNYAPSVNAIKQYFNTNIGTLANLNTTDKSNLVNAINSVVESGSNANGKYTKFADGTMICRNKVTFTATMVEWGNMYGYDYQPTNGIPFAQPFIEMPDVSAMVIGDAAALIQRLVFTKDIISQISISRPNKRDDNYEVSYTAIGKWK